MQALMDQEQAYLQALSQATAYRVTDGHLEIDSAAGETSLVFARHEEFPTDPSGLLGTVWQLVSIDGRSPIEGSAISLAFHNEYRLSGHAGCRDYVATYQASGDNMNLLFEAMIDADCPMHDALLEQEAQLLGILAQSHLRLGEGQLEVFGERGGILVFESLSEDSIASLESTPWVLTAFVEEKVVEDMAAPLVMPRDRLAEVEITLMLRDGAANGSAGCNTYYAAYVTDGWSIAFENPATTEMACTDPAGIMTQEHRYLDLLEAASTYHIYGRHLWLETGDGRALVFTAW
jgi:heat shock protein HslJ